MIAVLSANALCTAAEAQNKIDYPNISRRGRGRFRPIYEMNQQQQEMIDYLWTENEVLKEKLGKKRILLNDDQRRRLAIKGKKDLRPKDAVGNRHSVHAGYDIALASSARCAQMGL